MDGFENPGLRQSKIPAPRGLLLSGLQEITDSQHNVRSQASMIRPPAPTALKRPASELQQKSETKRQTLAARSGDCSSKHIPAGGLSVAGDLAGTGIRPVSLVAPQNKQLKKAPKSAYQARPTSNALGRSVTSLGHHARISGPGAGMASRKQSVSNQHRAQSNRSRPLTSLDQYSDDESTAVGGNQPNVLDVNERLRGVESQFDDVKEFMNQALAQQKAQEDMVELAKTRACELQRQRDQWEEKHSTLQRESDSLKELLQSTTVALEKEKREKSYLLEDQQRQHQRELEDLRRNLRDESDRLQRSHREELEALERRHRAVQEERQSHAALEIQDLKAKLGLEHRDLNLAVQEKDRELQQSQAACDRLKHTLEEEGAIRGSLQQRLADAASLNIDLEERIRALQAQVDFLKSDSRQQSDHFSEMEARMQQALKTADEARQQLVKEETERRILFNKYQELKGNIRVMCRVRPAAGSFESEEADILFPDAKMSSSQIDITGPEEKSSLGVVSRKVTPFEFDRVFAPKVGNEEVFGEISQLVQSALDGYNVCIFCYGQTGSGKTYTMSSPDGMIPRATHMIYDNIKKLEEKSWTYTMDGSFVEVYNEELNDLLACPPGGGSAGKETEGKKKLEIRHDEARKSTTVVNCRTEQLDSAEKVEMMLQLAQSNRSVAATRANERSSRSHSVFILKLVGENAATGERCEGTLNLVDLAGSERLKQSGAEGDRKKETQSINKSLACLGDVIEALGRGAPHIPYRNSKLTHLLQYSLGGNSKTLMFVMISPLEAHLKETLTSLRFATKVYNTHIGTAKSTKKTKDRSSDA